MTIDSTGFWLDLLEIVWVNILLSGDNAVVIALTARTLAPGRQRVAIVSGSAVAIALRIVLTLLAATLLSMPWLKTAGALLLLYIGVGLLAPEKSGNEPKAGGNVWGAIRTIVVADLVMSLDNVIAVAAAAHGSLVLLIVGLVLSIPLVVFGSTLLLKVIERLPAIVWLGAALLGFIAGGMLVEDPALAEAMSRVSQSVHAPHQTLALIAGAAGALMVVAIGKIRAMAAKPDR